MKTSPRKEFRLKDAVPPGPYKTQNERWDAIEKLIALEHDRAEAGFEPILNKELIQWMDLNRDEILAESKKPTFTEFYLARAKKVVGSELARSAKQVVEVLESLSSDVAAMTPKDKKDYITLYLTAMDKFGLAEIDINKGQVEEEFDTDDALAECVQLVNWLKNRNICVQNIVKGAIHGVKQERTDNRGGVKEINETVEVAQAPEVREPSGPDKVMETVQVQLPTAE